MGSTAVEEANVTVRALLEALNATAVPAARRQRVPQAFLEAVRLLYILLFFLGLLNLIVLFLIPCIPRLRTVSSVNVFSLCLASLLYTLVVPFILSMQYAGTWIFPHWVCKAVLSVEAVTKHGTMAFVGLAALERYLAVCQAKLYQERLGFRTALGGALVGWAVCALAMAPVIVWSGSRTVPRPTTADPNATKTYCLPFPVRSDPVLSRKTFLSFSFVVLFALPGLGLFFSYLSILKKLRDSNRRMARFSTREGPKGLGEAGAETTTPLLSRQRTRVSRSATRMVLALIGCYMACWTPYYVLQFVGVHFPAIRHVSPGVFLPLSNVVHLLPYVSCAANPLLYLLLTDNFRALLKSRRQSRPAPSQAQASAASLVADMAKTPARLARLLPSRLSRSRPSHTAVSNGRQVSVARKPSPQPQVREPPPETEPQQEPQQESPPESPPTPPISPSNDVYL